MFKIDPSFWNKENLNHIVYGDSVAEHHNIVVGFKNNDYSVSKLTLDDLWYTLSLFENPNMRSDGKEVMFISDQIKIQTYINRRISFNFPNLIIRNYYRNRQLLSITTEDDFELTITKDHSLIDIDGKSIHPDNAKYVLFTDGKSVHQSFITKRNVIKYTGYVYDLSIEPSHNFIVDNCVVKNTDSLYINIPDIEYSNPEEADEKANEICVILNEKIRSVIDNCLLPKMNVDPSHNHTSFKLESVSSSMILLDIKKNYAYKELANKRKIRSTPKIKYVGIPVVRSDYSKFAQSFIKKLIDDIALNDTCDKQDELLKLGNMMYTKMIESLESLDIHYIGTPGRWKYYDNYKNEPFIIIGMRLYNTIFDKEIFRPGTSGLSIAIDVKDVDMFLRKIEKIKSKKYYLNNVNINNINYIVVPYNFEKDELRSKLKEYEISINFKETWEKNYSKIARSIVEVIRR
jgi:hypothetical protein